VIIHDGSAKIDVEVKSRHMMVYTSNYDVWKSKLFNDETRILFIVSNIRKIDGKTFATKCLSLYLWNEIVNSNLLIYVFIKKIEVFLKEKILKII